MIFLIDHAGVGLVHADTNYSIHIYYNIIARYLCRYININFSQPHTILVSCEAMILS